MGDLDEQVSAVLADPGFREAVQAHARGFTALYADTPQAVPIMADLGRFVIVAAVFCLPQPVTLSAIAGLGAGHASRGRVANHLTALRQAGVLEEARGDGRSRPVLPTPWLEDWMRGWYVAMTAPAHRWWRAATPPPPPSPAAIASYVGQILAAGQRGLSAFTSVPGQERMMTLVGGHLFILELILAQTDHPVGQPVAFSRRAFAARYGVSRAHAVDLAAEAEALGWLVRHDDSRIALTPAFRAETDRWHAIHFVLANITQAQALIPALEAQRR